ncbi:MAG: DUF2971 domain-containing protein [Hominimerdicola sp.]
MVLYKFFRPTDCSIDNLINQQIWLSRVFDFNDPFEGNIEYNRNRYAAESLLQSQNNHRINQHDRDILESIIQLYETSENSDDADEKVGLKVLMLSEDIKCEYYTRMGSCANKISYIHNGNAFLVCCFANLEKDETMLENMLMWTHYAENFKGFCVRYDINDNDPILENFYDIIYKVSNPLTFSELNTLVYSNTDEAVNLYTKRLNYKHPQWIYEKEKRIIIDTNIFENDKFKHKKNGVLLDFSYVSKIFFGLKMYSKENGKVDRRGLKKCRKIINAFKDSDVEILCTYRDENKIKLKSMCYIYDKLLRKKNSSLLIKPLEILRKIVSALRKKFCKINKFNKKQV